MKNEKINYARLVIQMRSAQIRYRDSRKTDDHRAQARYFSDMRRLEKEVDRLSAILVIENNIQVNNFIFS